MFEKKGEFLRSHRKQNNYLIMIFQQVRTTRKHFQWHSNHREGCGEVVFLQGCCDQVSPLPEGLRVRNWPTIILFIFGNTKKSQRAKSGL